MTLDAALVTSDALSSNAPQQPLALVAVGGGGGSPRGEVVGSSRTDGVDEGLQGLLVHVHLLLPW